MIVRVSVFLLVATVLFTGPVGVPGFAQSTSYTVNLATATIAGKSEAILVDSNGMALYYLTSDRPTVSTCSGSCANIWLPLLSTTAPTGPQSLPGKLALVTTVSGPQVSYNGHLLYRYAADTGPGQVNGNNRSGPAGGKWLVATSSLKIPSNETPGDNPGDGKGY